MKKRKKEQNKDLEYSHINCRNLRKFVQFLLPFCWNVLLFLMIFGKMLRCFLGCLTYWLACSVLRPSTPFVGRMDGWLAGWLDRWMDGLVWLTWLTWVLFVSNKVKWWNAFQRKVVKRNHNKNKYIARSQMLIRVYNWKWKFPSFIAYPILVSTCKP